MLSSSIEGGIFGEVEVKAASPKKFCINRSSIEGGIFGNEIAQKPGTAGSQRTDSSITGGIFGGGAYETDAAAMPKPAMAKLDIEKMAVAGMVAGTILLSTFFVWYLVTSGPSYFSRLFG